VYRPRSQSSSSGFISPKLTQTVDRDDGLRFQAPILLKMFILGTYQKFASVRG